MGSLTTAASVSLEAAVTLHLSYVFMLWLRLCGAALLSCRRDGTLESSITSSTRIRHVPAPAPSGIMKHHQKGFDAVNR
eukprot:2440732-Pyramimonas_sp.AAC.1